MAFTSSANWHTGGNNNNTGSTNINLNGTGVVVNAYSLFDDGNRFQLTPVEDFPEEELAAARAILHFRLTGDFHSVGHTGRPLMKNGMGDVAEVHYYYYVNPNQGSDDGSYDNRSDVKANNGIVLQLPFYDYFKDPDKDNMNGNNMEPNTYFRWYDYRTDAMPAGIETVNGAVKHRITPWDQANVKKVFDKNDKDLGLFYYDNGTPSLNPNARNVGVIYNIPDSAQYADWKGDIIGCDVSRYYDYNDEATPNMHVFTHEPTLSVRYVFHILPAKKLADDMEASLKRAKSDSLTLQDHALLVFGAKDGNATMNLRTQFSRLKDYWFHPYSGTANVYHKASETSYSFANNGSFSDDIKRATGTEWRVYNADSTAYRVFATTTADQYGGRHGENNKRLQDRDLDISLNREVGSGMSTANDGISDGMRIHALNGAGWVDLDGVTSATVDSIKINDECFIVGYVTNGNDKCPFFNARLEFNHLYPRSDAQILANNLTDRTSSYLQSQFGSPVTVFSFDSENSSQNFSSPSSIWSQDNYDPMSSPFEQRQYGYVYWGLQNYCDGLGRSYSGHFMNLLHGEYVIAKSLEMNGKTVYDRTHATQDSQYGYFFYTDASQESRQIGYQDFDGNLCSGSQIIISAYVVSANSGRTQSQPELRFSLYGVNKDASGNLLSEKLFASVCTGNFRNNIDNYWNGSNFDAGTWYQVFGAVTLPSGVGIENYSSFRITIDNYCNDTNGADYAIDDIRVYQNNSKLSVIQSPALCSTDEASNAVHIKIKGNYNVLREVSGAEAEDKKVYYRFMRANGTAVTGTNFYGDGKDKYGEADLPANYDASLTVGDGVNSTSKFELSTTGQREVVLVYRGFNLSQDSTFYVSYNFRNPDNENQWSRNNAICSMYSSTFEMVRQNLVIDGVENGNITVTVACGKDTTANYTPIHVGVTAPDKTSGGKTILNNIHFDWFNGSLRDYNALKADGDDSVTLAGAVDHYRAVYPKGAYDTNNAADQTATNGMVYSAADKALIEKYLYNDTDKKDGILWMSGETSLSKAPLSAGRDTILAIPIEDQVTISDTIKYDICTEPVEMYVRGLSNGPGINFGMRNINNPSTERYRSIRIGLPQIRAMKENGVLRVPIEDKRWQRDVENQEDLRFVDSDRKPSTKVYISSSNDPTIPSSGAVQIAELQSTELPQDSLTLNLCHFNTNVIHEGYWYELGFQFLRTDNAEGVSSDLSQCVGESFLILKIVPEYLTWNPVADNGRNSNWNNDLNWRRSTAGELYDASYKDYRTPTYLFQLHDGQGNVVENGNVEGNKAWHYNTDVDSTLTGSQPNAYVPMYFSKVIIPTLTFRPYPVLGYLGKQAGTNLILDMTIDNSSAPTDYIQYDLEATPANADSSIYNCVVFDGNICEQICFKSTAQLRNQQFLNYKKAWTELSLPINSWGTFTTPMDHTLAGDMYVPKVNAVQQTPLFKDIHYDDVDAVDKNGKPWISEEASGTKYGLYGKAGDGIYSRLRMPTYQKLWAVNTTEYAESSDSYSTYDQPYVMLVLPSADSGDDMELKEGINAGGLNVWSHTFNVVGESSSLTPYDKNNDALRGIYRDGYGVAGKIGDDYATPSKVGDDWHGYNAVMRLPKADKSYTYYNVGSDGKAHEASRKVDVSNYRVDNYRLGIKYNPVSGDLGVASLTTDSVYPSSMHYCLVGNPYTSSISVREFVSSNSDILRPVCRVDTTNGSVDSTWVNRLWVIRADTLFEIRADDPNASIYPGQAFFISVNNPGTDVVQFTTRMEVDPNSSIYLLNAISIPRGTAKAYTLTRSTDVTNIINHGVDSQLYCWSPSSGVLAVSGESIRCVEIYNVSGQLVNRAEMPGTEKQFNVGTGVYIVKATLKNGSTQSQKLAVR